MWASECRCRLFRGTSFQTATQRWRQLCVRLCCASRRLWKISSRRSFPNSLFLARRFIYFFSPQHTLAQSTIHKIAQRVLFFLFVRCVLYIQRCRAIYIYDLFGLAHNDPNVTQIPVFRFSLQLITHQFPCVSFDFSSFRARTNAHKHARVRIRTS